MPIKTRDIDIEGVEVADPDDEDYHPPGSGGCWICNRGPEEGEMEFSVEFDTYYHIECLEKAGYDTLLDYERDNNAR